LTYLTAVELPRAGGETEFADMQAAYDALTDDRKALLEGKHMIHSWTTLRRYEPSIPPLYDEDAPPPAVHPVVRTVNGRKGLFLSGQTAYYVGNLPFDDGKALYDELMAHATGPVFVYRHEWSIGDLLMWDDRTTMHRARPFDMSERRVMRRAETVGTDVPA
jgi:alpha-ketoglutarate-dependent taurine dioxygenase